jgi:CheY-like chemotaxis protein
MSDLVLIVDDEPDVRLLLRLAFEARGWKVDEVSGGHEALERCSAPPAPDVIVLDHRMPGLAGIAVARQLQGQGFPGRIVLHSAYLSPDLEAEAEQAGIPVAAKGQLRQLFALLAKDNAPEKR